MDSVQNVQAGINAPHFGEQIRREIQAEGPGGFAKMMESVLIQQLLQQMNKSLVTGGMFGNSHQARMYQGMFMEALAESISDSGGLGVAEIIEKQLLSKFRSVDENGASLPVGGNALTNSRWRKNVTAVKTAKFQSLANREGIKEHEE